VASNGSSRPRGTCFSEDEVKILDKALSLAWDRFLKTGMMNAQNMAEAQQILGQRIMSSAADGQLDPWLLARDALFHLWQLKFTGEPLVRVPPRKRRPRIRS